MHKANNFVAHKKKKINLIANKQLKKEHKEVGCCEADEPKHSEHSDDDGHDHSSGSDSTFKMFFSPAIISLVCYSLLLLFDNWFPQSWFRGWVRIIWYIVAYAPVGLPVLKEAIQSIGKGEVFSEFLLMSIATIGAFAIGEYPEAVAVMLFYAVGRSISNISRKRAKIILKHYLTNDLMK